MWVMEMDWQQVLERLCTDRKSGAVVLAKRAAGLLVWMAQEGMEVSALIATAERLFSAHPGMALLWHLVKTVRQNAEQPRAIPKALQQFVAEMEAHVQDAIAKAAYWLPKGCVLTHSFSSLVLRALTLAHQQGKNLQVVCTASHPGGEGIRLAKALAREGVAVTLVADLQAFTWLPKCQVMLVGADALCWDGLVHKVGTRPLAVAAKQVRVPVWSVATSEKRLPLHWNDAMKGYAPPIVKFLIPQDLTLYDLTEWQLVEAVITEHGIQCPNDFR